jgi:hypothetical protein
MTIPDGHEGAWPLLRFAETLSEFRAADAVRAIADQVGLSEEEHRHFLSAPWP